LISIFFFFFWNERNDALVQLTHWAQKGVRMIKWLPNSMGIDASHDKCRPFYERAKELKMVLLIHVGFENSIDMGEVIQEYGNPLRLRCPLDMGVKVIAAHCASEGSSLDLESTENPRPFKDNFHLFLRLMNDPKYEGLLFADISSMTALNRCGEPLATMLALSDLHHRLINGSDYVVPAIRMVVSTKLLAYHGYINEDERRLLNEIYEYNPLLFDFVAKRVLRAPSNSSRPGTKFSPSVFMLNKELFS